MTGEPQHAHFVWAGCPHATKGEVHFPCKDCAWESNVAAETKAKKKGKT